MARKTETSEPIPRPGDAPPVLFRVTQEGFATGRAIFVKLAKAIGPALGALATGGKEPLAAALRSATENLSDADLAWLTEKLGASTQFSTDGGEKWPFMTKDNQEELFGGNLVLYFGWLYFALRVNFSDFSDALAALGAPGQKGETPDASQRSPNS